jgi:hypothetical protein
MYKSIAVTNYPNICNILPVSDPAKQAAQVVKHHVLKQVKDNNMKDRRHLLLYLT